MTEPQNNYDPIAEIYAQKFQDEMDHKPFDRKALELLHEKVGDTGAICDLGCGCGQVAAYLHRRGARVCGIDLSPEMIRHAKRLNSEISFQSGDMRSLTDIPNNTFTGIAAFYSIIHVPRTAIAVVLAEMRRILRPNGEILLTFHIGRETLHFDELWGEPVSLDFHFFETQEMKNWLGEAGFQLAEVIERDPYPTDIEVQTRRAYVFATNRKPT